MERLDRSNEALARIRAYLRWAFRSQKGALFVLKGKAVPVF